MSLLWISLLFLAISARHAPFRNRVDDTTHSSSLKYEELHGNDPNPNPNSVVLSRDGKVRFTILTSKLVRIEYGEFDNRPSLSVIHRNLPAVEFRTDRNSSSGLVIRTNDIELYYAEGYPFTSSSLQAVNKNQTWRYGDLPNGNLLGTIRTLDTLGPTNLNCSTFIDPDAHCEYGLVSRDGWAVFDDTKTPRLGEEDWWDGYGFEDVDIYLFMHGNDYKGAVGDYAKIGGNIPLPPRYMFGTLWTRWYDYDQLDLKQLVSGFSVRGLPLDMLIIDMNWHIKP